MPVCSEVPSPSARIDAHVNWQAQGIRNGRPAVSVPDKRIKFRSRSIAFQMNLGSHRAKAYDLIV
jgi:hypothetical protein